jgi:hypothetical protein
MNSAECIKDLMNNIIPKMDYYYPEKKVYRWLVTSYLADEIYSDMISNTNFALSN